jgi:hypothetical protein
MKAAPNEAVELIAAGGRFSQLAASLAAAIAHFCRWARSGEQDYGD